MNQSVVAIVALALIVLNVYTYIQAKRYTHGQGDFNVLYAYAGGAIGALFGLHLTRKKTVHAPKLLQLQVLILAVGWSLMILVLL
ncbi:MULTISPECIES: hypothetical protein [Exiguobacterium]|jgi:uncharacterized membrane protein YsdA (DUF1294 family)|uniref:hypothetical protein n=1 Tax=Exiguobacterium TaxID=33986 RepID=UPI001BEBF582|nr:MULTISPECIES: hypothetical protein [Exiguobacterium]MCA0980705.1 hypothetical protein [Exiguobacterium aestuarii]MDE0562239.1 hypothetical protein [Exiguobacterium sp. B2(2022)]